MLVKCNINDEEDHVLIEGNYEENIFKSFARLRLHQIWFRIGESNSGLCGESTKSPSRWVPDLVESQLLLIRLKPLPRIHHSQSHYHIIINLQQAHNQNYYCRVKNLFIRWFCFGSVSVVFEIPVAIREAWNWMITDSVSNIASTSAPAYGKQASDVWKTFTLEENSTKAKSLLRCLSIIQRRRRISLRTHYAAQGDTTSNAKECKLNEFCVHARVFCRADCRICGQSFAMIKSKGFRELRASPS
ncbi:hypothetical protein ROZALSC1DRAFT_20613 [Rozella allomycis CSF55]|uniref:Uncharacterized protein n=1 Tax=Rozella allomycis (strain CSF55) TaxID=988480 RepID=A0A4P9YPW9_ROZAC|nr:hypothetical protein ROZALSC1DRAFT_20613 [Rozella allomycis CSF55]